MFRVLLMLRLFTTAVWFVISELRDAADDREGSNGLDPQNGANVLEEQ